MGLFTVYVSPLPNLPKQALIIPCYHCQLHHFQIPVKYRPLHTLLSAPNSPYLPLYFNLEELSFLFHSVPQTSPRVSGSNHSGTSSQTNVQSFALNLAQIWVTKLQRLGSFIPNLDNPTLIGVSKQPLPTETLDFFNVTSHRHKNTELVKINRQVGSSHSFFAPRIHGI